MSSLTTTNSYTSRLYCAPALIYILLTMIGIVSMLWTMSGFGLIVTVFFSFLWAFFLNFLCSTGNSSLAWFLVLFPLIINFLIAIISYQLLLNPNSYNYLGPNNEQQSVSVPLPNTNTVANNNPINNNPINNAPITNNSPITNNAPIINTAPIINAAPAISAAPVISNSNFITTFRPNR